MSRSVHMLYAQILYVTGDPHLLRPGRHGVHIQSHCQPSSLGEESCVSLTQSLSLLSQPHPGSPPPYLLISHTTRTGISRQNERTAAALLEILAEGHCLGCEVMQNTGVGSQHNWSWISG